MSTSFHNQQNRLQNSQLTLNQGAYSDLELLIHCRLKAKQFRLAPPKGVKSDFSGVYQSKLRGRGIDFSEVRIYQPGDDIRSIDWRVTARTQKTHTKVFQEERERPVILLVDQSSSMFFGSQHCFKSVLAAELASIIAWSALSNSDRVGGVVFNDRDHMEVRPKKSKKAVLQLLSSINQYNHKLTVDNLEDKPFDLGPILLQTRQVSRPGSAIFIISDFEGLSPSAERQIALLRRHTEIIAIHTHDPLEYELPKPGLYSVTNGEQRLTLNTFDQHYRQSFAEHSYSHRQDIQSFFLKQGIPFASIATNSEYILKLKSYLAQSPNQRKE